MLNSFLIGHTCQSRVLGGTRCFQLFVSRTAGELNKQRIPTTTSKNRRRNNLSLLCPLLICWRIGGRRGSKGFLFRSETTRRAKARGGPTLNSNGSAQVYETKEYDHPGSDSGEQKSFFDDEPQDRLVLSAFTPLTFATFLARGSRTPPHQPPPPTLQAVLVPILQILHPCHFSSSLPAFFPGRGRHDDDVLL